MLRHTWSSNRPLPLKRYGFTSDVRLDILPRRESPSFSSHERHRRNKLSSLNTPKWLARSSPKEVRHSDRIRLSFRAFQQEFFLHLEPTENLVHPEGTLVRYVDQDPLTGESIVTRTETIYAHNVRAYQGVVVHADHSSKRMAEDSVGVRREAESILEGEGVMGRAAILLRDDGSESGSHSFEGTFSWAGNEHTIQLPVNYHTSRQDGDPSLSKRSLERGTPLVHRMSDVMTTLEARSIGIRAANESMGCNSDSHDFNTQNILLMTDTNNNDFSVSPISFFAPPKQAMRRSLFPLIRNGAADFFGRSKAMEEVDVKERGHYSYEMASLLRRQSTGGDVLGGNSNDSYTADIGSTTGCPSSARAVYMGVASDCTYTARFSNDSAVRTQILNNMNSVSNIYRSTFNVSLGVVELEIRASSNCPSTNTGNNAWNVDCDTLDLDDRLSAFSQWRGSIAANGTGLWHLLTACSSGSEVGVAWLGTLCQTSASGSGTDIISGTGVSSVTQQEAQVMAHEIGHNFGAIHDCVSGCSISGTTASQSGGAICCPQTSSSCNSNAAYIMSPVSQQATQIFSPCSIGNICTMLGSGLNTTCISDPSTNPRETLSIQQCGNGILEPGEECDAGISGSNCCTTSCRLTSGSVCDPESSACCNSSCQYASATTVCRAAVDPLCDTAEMCTGTNSTCPVDVRKADGSSCGGDDLTCASGHCTSRNLQCQEQSSSGMNFTAACPVSADSSCSISCQDPSSSSSCLVLQTNFVDGTDCGYGGRCEGGDCKSGSWQDTFQSWYRNNLRISIPVTIVIAILILALLYGISRCIYTRVQRGNVQKGGGRQPGFYAPPPPPSHPNGYQMPPQQQTSYPQSEQQGAWIDPHSYNGPSTHQGYHQPPHNPYPSY
ncbi:hypothetical protein CBS101457_005357 [Exobasidium rhododendri]|nr:hypothetical protein CBS101457_005357 [Exobasidium rhododendri]